MPHIRLNTDQLHKVGSYLVGQAQCLEEIGHSLQKAIGSLDTWAWDGASRRQAESLLSRVRPESNRLAQQLRDLGRQLIRIAGAFEQADSQSAAGVDAIPWSAFRPLMGWFTNPALRVGSLLAGGGGTAAIALTALSVTGTEGSVSFVERLRGIPSTVARWLSPAITTVAGWFGWHDLIPEKPGEPVSWEELEEVEVREPSKTLDGKPVAPSQPQPKVSGEVTTAPLPPRSLTPALRQTRGSYECTPTAASMVLEYWHRRDPNHQTRKPEELIQGLGNRFSPRSGINADELVAGLTEMNLGYKRSCLVGYRSRPGRSHPGWLVGNVRRKPGFLAAGYVPDRGMAGKRP